MLKRSTKFPNLTQSAWWILEFSNFFLGLYYVDIALGTKNKISYLLWNVITADTALANILNETSMHLVSSQFLKLKIKHDKESLLFISSLYLKLKILFKHVSHISVPKMKWEVVDVIQVIFKRGLKAFNTMTLVQLDFCITHKTNKW